MADESGRLTGIRQIVRLRELLQRWQSITFRAKPPDDDKDVDEPPPNAANDNDNDVDDDSRPLLPPPSGIPPCIDKRLKSVLEQCESDEESCMSPEPPPDVPRGYCPVYVGMERRRFVVPTAYLGLPVFRRLLEKAEEEFGFDYHYDGALTIPCETETFKFILQVMERHQKGLIDDEGNPTGVEESSKEMSSEEQD